MTRPSGRHTFDSSNTRHNIARILAALAEPMTYAQLCQSLHMTDRSVRHYLAHLRAAPNKRVYLKAHMPIPNGYVALFALGNKRDATKKVQTEAERNAKYRAKVKASPERWERRQRLNSARWAIKKAKRTPNTWLTILGAQP